LTPYRHVGRACRAHNPRWAFAPTSGRGAGIHGGRFNPPGLDALYLSERQETAWLEAQQGLAFKPQPLTICAYEVDCTGMVDLMDATVLAELGVALDDLGCAWEEILDRGRRPPTWALADVLRGLGRAGVRVPSFAPGAGPRDVNLVLWDWSGEPPRLVRVIDDEGRLPNDQSSWS
jgi:RES domain-containing protein